jgi:cell division inhibitor SulA
MEEVICMDSQKIEDVLSDMSRTAKKEMLDNLVLTLLKDLTETDKKDLLRTAVIGQKEGHHLTTMVEH